MQTESREHYDQWHREALRDEEATAYAARFHAWLLALLQPAPGGRLLDVACGLGAFLADAQGRGFEVTGVDFSEVAAQAARARLGAGGSVLVASGDDLPFDADSFDAVTCIGSLEHFPDPAAGAAEIARVLRPDGRALIFVPNLFFLGHVYFGLRHGIQPSEAGQSFSETFLSSGGWRTLLTDAGLEVQAMHPYNEIHGTDKVGPVTRWTWNRLQRLVPRHGAYAFAFVCAPAR
jgi:SAM-dependent methyltransferase